MKRKSIMVFFGVIIIGFSVALLNLSGFGVDSYTCMSMALSQYLPVSFGI